MFFTSQEFNTKRIPNATKLYEYFLWTRRHPMGQGSAWGCSEGWTSQQGTQGGPGAPWWLVPTQVTPPSVGLGSRNYLIWYKKSSQSFVPFRELLFLHKNNTMVVLLKTTSVRVSFIQIMQIRVQNKSKSVRKSRYDGNVSRHIWNIRQCLHENWEVFVTLLGVHG